MFPPTASLCALAIAALNAAPPSLATYEFGFSLNDGQYFIYKVFDGEVVESDPISLQSFILQASGRESSRANPEGLDLFDLHKIEKCESAVDSIARRTDTYCDALNDLWKLRYGGATSGTYTAGWAGELNEPSVRQQIILQAYRSPAYEHWLGPYFGKQAFQLLHDIQDPDWVSTYARGG